MGAAEVSRFLSSLAVERDVAASTQNQALAALLFLYKDVLDRDPGWVEGVVRAKRPQRLPVVLSRQEVDDLLSALRGVPWMVGTLLYGAGLRLMECLRLRVKDVDFDRGEIVVREGQGEQGSGHDAAGVRRPQTRSTPRTGSQTARRRPRRRIRARLAAERPGPQIPASGPRMGMAMGLPGLNDFNRPAKRRTATAPPARIRAAAGYPRGETTRRDHKARRPPHVETLFCHASPGIRL